MKNLNRPELNRMRVKHPTVGGYGDETCGAFALRSPIDSGEIHIIASSGAEWDHVSVSRANRCPNWPEMDFVCRLFFAADEVVIQYHIPPSENISVHRYCLHLWRPQAVDIPRPPAWMVGPPTTTEDRAAMQAYIDQERR